MFDKAAVDEFLIELDREIDFPFELVIIGGSAAMLQYAAKGATEDIDTFNNVGRLLEAKERLAKRGLSIPLKEASVRFGPSGFAERLVQYADLPLARLRVFVPEIHDLILFKISRLEEKDVADIRGLAHSASLNEAVFLKRMLTESICEYVGDEVLFIGLYLDAMETIFGEKVANRHEKKIRAAGYKTRY
jgi:hypothetical protein